MIALAIGILGFVKAIRGNKSSQIIAVFALVNWGVGLSGLPQLGANVNYFLPGLAGCALLLPFAIDMVAENLNWKLTLAAVILTLVWGMYSQIDGARYLLSTHFARATRPYAALAGFKLLSDQPVFPVHGRDPDFLDPYTAHELELAHNLDATPIVQQAQRGDYDLVILTGTGSWHVMSSFRGISFISPAIVEALNEHYSVLCSTITSVVLQPRKREVGASPDVLGSVLGRPCGLGAHGRNPELILAPDAR